MVVGGAAMLLHEAVDRPTEDLDLFVEQVGAVQRLAAALEIALMAEGFGVTRVQDADSFARLEVRGGEADSTRVDLALDARIRSPVPSRGPGSFDFRRR